ncbi:MAG TPA: hypothetical protein DCE56_41195 [Cyanobacteria bacterium UBA8553]|nr:hypothetical protein [Cyanobacteria bacterium UBA8553]
MFISPTVVSAAHRPNLKIARGAGEAGEAGGEKFSFLLLLLLLLLREGFANGEGFANVVSDSSWCLI